MTTRGVPQALGAVLVVAALVAGGLGLPAVAAAEAAAGGLFTPVDPARVLDTRNGTGATRAVVPGGGTVSFSVGGRAGVPADAAAAVLNVTVTSASRPGHVTAYPAGREAPLASNLNFVAGQTIANAVTVKLGEDGRVTLYNGSSASINLVADVSGWFTAGTTSTPGAFTPLVPSRLLDTRNGTGAEAASVPAGGAVSFDVAGAGGVPSSGAAAAVLNVTVTGAVQPGHVTAHPAGGPAPIASNLNFVARQTIANAVTVKLGTDGRVTLRNGSTGPVQLVADVAGWFADGAGASATGAFTPTVPQRLLDTRDGTGASRAAAVPANGSITLDVAGRSGLPYPGTGAAVLNVTVTRPGKPGHVTVAPSGRPAPLASNLNFAAGQTIANQVSVKLSPSGRATLHNGSTAPVHLVADLAGWYRGADEGLPNLVHAAAVAEEYGSRDTQVFDMTPDGRHVLILSPGPTSGVGVPALNLVDTTMGTVTSVTVPSEASRDDGYVYDAAISDDGRFVAFQSSSSVLVPGDTNQTSDIFLRDMELSTTSKVLRNDGGQWVSRNHGKLDISGDGRFVAFAAVADGIVSGHSSDGTLDIFVWDRTNRTSTVLPRNPLRSNLTEDSPSLSRDGRYVALLTNASHVSVDSGYDNDVYVYDRTAGTYRWVSHTPAVRRANADPFEPMLSADGRTVAWYSNASDLTPGDRNGATDIFVRRWADSGPTINVTQDVRGDYRYWSSYKTALSPDGTHIAFVLKSWEGTAPGDRSSEVVLVRDIATGTTREVTGRYANAASPVVGAAGLAVAFGTRQALLPTDRTSGADVYVRMFGSD